LHYTVDNSRTQKRHKLTWSKSYVVTKIVYEILVYLSHGESPISSLYEVLITNI